MAQGKRASETPATVFLKQYGVAYTGHVYEYVERGGTRVSAEALGEDEHAVVKTLVMAVARVPVGMYFATSCAPCTTGEDMPRRPRRRPA